MTEPVNKSILSHNSRYLVKKHSSPVEKYVRKAYELCRNHFYPVRNISYLVTPGDSFVLTLIDDESGNDRVAGVVSVNEIAHPPEVNDLSKEDLDYLIGKILSRKTRKAPDDIVMDFCSTRLNCDFTSAFSNQRFQIQLLKPTSESDCPEYFIPLENKGTEEDIGMDRSIPFCILSNNHDLSPGEIEQLKRFDKNLRFALVPLDQFIRNEIPRIRKSCCTGIIDALDSSGASYDIYLRGKVIGTAKIDDIVEAFGQLQTTDLQKIIRLIKDSNCSSRIEIEKAICDKARGSVSAGIDCNVTFNDLVDPQYRGKTFKVLFEAFTSNWENYTSSDLRRVRDLTLLSDNDAEVLEIFKGTTNPSFTFVRKGV